MTWINQLRLSSPHSASLNLIVGTASAFAPTFVIVRWSKRVL